jgi:fructoselysine-6-P-deglycase FrlB-like protein
MSIVEDTLKTQRECWGEISSRVLGNTARELPIETPKRILLFGVGSSHFAARLTAYALLRDRTRQRVPVIACDSLAVGVDVFPTRGDWAFAFSHRGKTPVTRKAIELCDREGAVSIMVTGQGVEQPESVRYQLTTTPLERTEAHTISVTGAICGVTSLLLGERAREEWETLRSIGDPNLDVLRGRAGNGPEVIVGEWEGEWLAREAALKIMEMARIPVRAYGTEEFFHGPRLAVTPENTVWHVAHPRDPRNLEVKRKLEIFVSATSALAWIPSLVELQWLALATALNLDRDPDAAP